MCYQFWEAMKSHSSLHGISCYCMNEKQRKHSLYLGTFRKGTEARESTCSFQETVVWLWGWEAGLNSHIIWNINYKIKPLQVMSLLLGTRQTHFLVLGHCAETALGDIPRIPTEHERSTQPRKAEKKRKRKKRKKKKSSSEVGAGMLFVFSLYSIGA